MESLLQNFNQNYSVDVINKEPWDKKTQMIIPITSTQLLIPDSAMILGAKAFLKIARLPFTVKEISNATDVSPNGKLPVLRCGSLVVSELNGIIQLARAKGKLLGGELESVPRLDLAAYMSLVQNILGNALMYFTWVDDTVYRYHTRTRVAAAYNFPLRLFLPWSMRKTIIQQLNILDRGQRRPFEVYEEVETCLLALCDRLGDAEYFFGQSPTELDALAFGYLFTIINEPLPGNQLGNIVRQHPKLVQFCERFEKKYFGKLRSREWVK